MGVRTREVSCVSTAGTHWTWNEGSSLSCVLGLVDVVRGRFASCVLLDMQKSIRKGLDLFLLLGRKKETIESVEGHSLTCSKAKRTGDPGVFEPLSLLIAL